MENRVFDAYKRDMKHNVRLMSKDDQARLHREYKAYGDSEAYTVLVHSLLPMVPHIVGRAIKERKAFGAEFDDMVQAGNIGLLQAIESWDPDKKAPLTTWAGKYIAREVYREGRRNGLVTPPVGESAYYEPLQRHSGYSQSEYEDYAEDISLWALGDVNLWASEAQGEETVPSPEQELMDEEFWSAVEKLPEREANILERVYKFGDTVSAVADSMGVSRQAASQLHRKALSDVESLVDS